MSCGRFFDMDQASLEASIRELEAGARIHTSPCGDGEMVFHSWENGADSTVVLFHGGSGSWTHWLRNIEALGKSYNVIAPDLPGLGDSAALAPGYSAADAAACVETGLQALLMAKPFHLVAFSWGCTLAALVGPRLRPLSLMLVGPAALGDLLRRSQMQPLLRRSRSMTQDEIYAVNRENLARLMIHDRACIDDMAVYLQTRNTDRSRFNSPQFARTTLVLDGIRQIVAPLSVVYGEYDAPAYPHLDLRERLLREARPDVDFHVISEAGHWVQYERAAQFNRLCLDWLDANNGLRAAP